MQTNLSQTVDYHRYLRLFWKRKWIIAIPLILFPVLGGLYATQLPDSFKSSTLILVTPQKVPTRYIASSVTIGIQERLGTISQQIFSRTRLDQIIQEYDLFKEQKKDFAPEEIIQMMRSRIGLKVSREDAFELSYIDQNPRMAMLVTNKLASLFIEENLKVREQQAIGTSLFLGDEINRYREKVRQQEAEILAFKREHMNELREQQDSNQSKLGQLQNRLQINAQNINAASDRKVRLQQQLMEMEQRVLSETESKGTGGGAFSISRQLEELFAASGAGSGPSVDSSALRAIEEEIAKRKQDLEALLLNYTAKHPSAVQARAQIATLEERAAVERKKIEDQQAEIAARREEVAPDPEPTVEPETAGPAEPRYPPAYYQLQANLAEVDKEIARLTAQNKEIEQSVEVYQARIAATPMRELQLRQLSEGYGNVKSVLESLINKKLEADLSENLERKQKGEQFKILDPANLPEKPFSPKRLVYVGGGVVVGLGLGAGLVLLLDLLSFGVRSRDELISVLKVSVLGEIPTIETAADRRRRLMLRVGITGGLAVCVTATLLVVHLTVVPMPELAQKTIEKVKSTHWTTIR